MRLAEAEKLGAELAAEVAPYCRRVEVAGSVRRGRAEVKDLELVVVPRWGERADGLFGDPARVNLLHDWALALDAERLRWIKPGTAEVVAWPPKAGGRYWRGLLLRERLKLDLFLAERDNFGLIFLIRTGSAEFSQALVTYAKRIGWRSEFGRLWNPLNQFVATPDEADVFRALGLEFVEPAERTGPEALRARR